MVRRLLLAMVLAAMVVLATQPLTRIYHGTLLTRLLLGAAVASVALSTLLHRLPAWPVAPLSAAALAGYTFFAVNLSAHSGGIPGGLVPLWRDGLYNGIPRLLTALIPVEPQPDTVLVPIVATWLVGLAGTEVAVRGGRVLAGFAPPTLLYIGALVVVGPNAHPVGWVPLAFAALAAIGLTVAPRSGGAAARREDARPEAVASITPRARLALRARLVAGAAAALVVIVGLAVAVAPALADRVTGTPTDPRRYVTPPDLSADDENPLIRLSGWALNPSERLFDTDVTGALPAAHPSPSPSPSPSASPSAGPSPGTGPSAAASAIRVRLAVLSDFDGVNWRVDGDYREAGRVLPAVTGPAAPNQADARPGTDVRERITVRDLSGRLLPAVPDVREVDGLRVAYDQSTGTLIRPEGLSPGLTYTVHSQQSTVDVNLLPVADVPSGPSVARFLALGLGAPDAMTRLANQLGGEVAAPYQRAQALAQFLAEHYTLVTDAPSGHAYPNLNFFLFADRNLGGQRGTTEQFAASFAVLARMLGLPSRVVVGFTARPGQGAVFGRDALAWPEVLFTGLGWVPFDPLPQPDVPARPVEQDFMAKPPPTTAPPSVAPTIPVSASPSARHRSPSASAAAAGGSTDLPLVAGLAGGGLAILALLALFGIALARRAQRDRRLDRGPPRQRVAGAWREVLDALRLAGHPVPAHLAVTEVAAHGEAVLAEREPRSQLRLAAPSLNELATLANEVTFAAVEPDEDDARRARAQAVAYVAELSARQPWWRRLLAAVDPRPLRWERAQRRRRPLD
jgi:transglutaminase-like putative cysteine protease